MPGVKVVSGLGERRNGAGASGVIRARSEMVAAPGHRPERRLLKPDGARSLLLSFLGEFLLPWGRPVWAGSVIAALGLVDVDEAAARQAITRARTDGWITSTPVGRRGRLALTAEGAQLLREGNDRIWEFARNSGRWDGRITLLTLTTTGLTNALREEVRTRLRWSGFGQLSPATYMSFDEHAEDNAVIALTDLGMADRAASFRGEPGKIGDLRALVEQAWDLAGIAAAHRAFVADAYALLDQGTDPFVARFRLTHAWRHLPLTDPGLPRDYAPAAAAGERPAEVFLRLYARFEGPADRRWRQLAEEAETDA
jgi:phenylacetic acid degradation operon negative regulatory protein